MTKPLVTIAIPSFNQGRYLEDALRSVFEQDLALEVFVLDGGSSDNSVEVIKRWDKYLAGWRSSPDGGQAAAINEGIAMGSAPFVCWLNSDDWYLPGGLEKLAHVLVSSPNYSIAYGNAWNLDQRRGVRSSVWVEPFHRDRLAIRCIICQPATMIRREAWESVGGLNPNMRMAMDFDLWWRLYNQKRKFKYLDEVVAVNRDHELTKTRTKRALHYQEAIRTVRLQYGRVPWKWYLAQPYAVWYKTLAS